MRRLASLLLLLGPLLLGASAPAHAARPHEVPSDPVECVLNADSTVTCSGSVAGLGNRPVVARVDVDFACATRGNGHQPGGHLQSQTKPIEPRNGRITFSVTAGPATCPKGLEPVVGDTATVTILTTGGTVLFRTTETISRTSR